MLDVLVLVLLLDDDASTDTEAVGGGLTNAAVGRMLPADAGAGAGGGALLIF